MYGTAALAGLLLLILPRPEASAEAVRLMTGSNAFGAGWMYLDQDGCFVVTAGHVIRDAAGSVRPVVIRDGRGQGREWTIGAPLVLSDDPDIAVLPVLGANDPSVCGIPGRSRLTVAGIAERARVLHDGAIETTGRGETIRVPVTSFTARADAGRGELFAVRPANPSDQVAKGWSGSPVTDDKGLVGVVVEAEEGSTNALAVRADVIAKLVREAKSGRLELSKVARPVSFPEKTSQPQYAVMVLAGETINPEHGPDAVVRPKSRGWLVRPKNGVTTLVLHSEKNRSFSSVHLSVSPESASRMIGLEISVGLSSHAEENFQEIRYCANSSAAEMTCRFLEQDRSSVRLSIYWKSAEQVTIKSVYVE